MLDRFTTMAYIEPTPQATVESRIGLMVEVLDVHAGILRDRTTANFATLRFEWEQWIADWILDERAFRLVCSPLTLEQVKGLRVKIAETRSKGQLLDQLIALRAVLVKIKGEL